MRVAKIELDWNVLLVAFHGHEMSRVVSTLPDDARVVNMWIEYERNRTWLAVESASFDEVPEGFLMPEFTPVFTKQVTELAVIADLVSQKPCSKCGAPRDS